MRSTESITAAPASRLRWDRQFAMFARVVLAGRAGQPEDAARSMAEAIRLAAIYPTARNIGLRLVAEAAIADGWGTPKDWLRTAEEYFHEAEIPAVASACRTLLRQSGTPVAQRRRGTEEIPARLRAAKVTVREIRDAAPARGQAQQPRDRSSAPRVTANGGKARGEPAGENWAGRTGSRWPSSRRHSCPSRLARLVRRRSSVAVGPRGHEAGYPQQPVSLLLVALAAMMMGSRRTIPKKLALPAGLAG